METIGLIAAMPLESNALLRRIEKWDRITFGPFRGARFRFMERDCLLVISGMGLKRAVDGTRALLEALNPSLLISFGIAGAVNEDLDIGDVVVAGNTCLLEIARLGQFQPLASLSTEAWNAVTQALQPNGARMIGGTAITTRGSHVTPQSIEGVSNPILDMETAGIALVAGEEGIPLLSIRSISDGPKAPIPFDIESMLNDEDNFRIGKMFQFVLRNPRIILKSNQVVRNSRKAADHAAIALIAALCQPHPIIST